MQRFWFLFLLFMSVPLSAFGQSAPPIEFVEGLRNRGMADLALEYLQRISEHPSADLRDRISLEIAKTNLVLALQENDDRQRDIRWDQAERAYEKYLASPVDPIEGAEANLDLARLLTRRARLRVVVEPALRGDAKASRQSFDAAIRRIRTALDLLKSVNPAGTQQQLVANRMAEAKLEEQATRLHRAATMEGERRLRELEHIRVSFESLAAEYGGQNTGWVAKVMVGRCMMDLDNPFEARKQFDEIALQGSKVSPEATRLNRFYQVLLLSHDANNRNNLADTVRGCEEWLAMFPSFTTSEEGQGIRVALAKALIAQLGPTEVGAKAPPGARATLQRAERLVRDIANQIGPYAYPARMIRSDVAQSMAGEQLFGGIGKLESFEEAHLVAQGDAVVARRLANPAEQSARYRRAAQVLGRGLQMATANDSKKEVVDAQLMLAYLFLIGGDNYSAAVLGEFISATNPTSAGAQGLAYAISAYANLLSASRATLAAIDEIQADENRVRRAAEQMLAKWPDDLSTDVARFHLGLLDLESQRYVKAFDEFAAIRDGFPGCCEARYRAGITARMIQAPEVVMDAKAKAAILTRAIDGLRRLNLQSDNGGEDGFVGMCQAKLQLGTLLLFSEQSPATFVEMRRVGEAVQAALGERLSATHLARARLESEAERLILSGVIGESYLLVQQGRFDEAHTMLIPYATVIERSVKQWSQSPQLQESWFQSLMAARRDLALLYLRACVNGDRISRVSEAISCLRAMPAIGGLDGYRSGLLNVVADLKRDLELARLTKGESRERGLVIGLTAVLDEFKRAEDLTPEQRIFVAQANSAVHRHDKATTFLISVIEGRDDRQQDDTYRFAKIILAREYRQAGDFAKAKSLMREILGTPAKKGWGFDNLDVRKEAVALMHDEQNWAGGNRMAAEMQHKLRPVVEEYDTKAAQLRVAQSEQKTDEVAKLEADLQRLKPQREAFFEFYHLELRGIVKNTQEDKDGKSPAVLERVAVRVAKLEKAHPDLGGPVIQARFRTLIKSEPAIKARYLSEGGTLLNEK